MEQRDITRLLQDIKKKVPGSDLNVKNQYLERKGKIAERVMMKVAVQVILAPANTVAQADAFFSNVDRDAFLSLEESSNWKVKRDLRFHFMGVPLDWLKTTWETRKYFDYFSDGHGVLYGKMPRDELLKLAKQWEGEGLILSEGRKAIKNLFNNRKHKSLNVIPGFLVSRQWDLAEVIELERQGKLVEHIIDELAIPLATWGEEL